MEVISIERSTYEELLTSFNSFVTKMKEMANRGNGKGLSDWLDNQDVCQMLNISPRTLQTLRDNGTLAYSQINRKVYYKPKDVERILCIVADRDKNSKLYNLKMSSGKNRRDRWQGQVSEKKRNDALDLQTYNLQNYKTKIKMDKVEFNKQARLSDHLASP